MRDAETLLEQQLHQLGRRVLRDGGTVNAVAAKRHAEKQYEKFDDRRKIERHKTADEQIAALAAQAKKLPRKPK